MPLHRIYIGAGTNIGDRIENLTLAGQLLEPTVKILRTSAVYRTEPWGFSDQEEFFNLVWEAETSLSPENTLDYLKQIEQRMRREETFRYGPRVIDLDILLYDKLILETDSLTIPHTQIPQRRFVLEPLCDLIPNEKHPELGRTWQQILSDAPELGIQKLAQPLNLAAPVIRWGTKTYLMGILNLTRDSFSGDGLIKINEINHENLVQKAESFIENGADILDFGAESTRPGYSAVSAEEEMRRLVPAIKSVRKQYPDILISVDTSKAAVADAALNAGADWINDIGGGIRDPQMCGVALAHNARIVLMRSEPLSESLETMPQVIRELITILSQVEEKNLHPEQIILDPGIGFGTSARQNLDILRNLEEMKLLGYPILVGTSRKSFLGAYLQKEVSARLAGTAASVTLAIQNGADIVRVHDVEFMKDIVRLTDLIQR